MEMEMWVWNTFLAGANTGHVAGNLEELTLRKSQRREQN